MDVLTNLGGQRNDRNGVRGVENTSLDLDVTG